LCDFWVLYEVASFKITVFWDVTPCRQQSDNIICGLLGDYTASCGNYLPTFRDNVSVPSSRVEIQDPSKKDLYIRIICLVILTFFVLLYWF
jgi:hypothetical protein